MCFLIYIYIYIFFFLGGGIWVTHEHQTLLESIVRQVSCVLVLYKAKHTEVCSPRASHGNRGTFLRQCQDKNSPAFDMH